LWSVDVDHRVLADAIAKVSADAVVRELSDDDMADVLALDAATVGDYPGGVATAHPPLTVATAALGPERRAWGALVDGELVAVTMLDVDLPVVETSFTVVSRAWRGRGFATAVKAASIRDLTAAGAARFRTGGAAENLGSIAANRAVGYVLDEEWLTLAPP
jgi:predicted GNAT family acetyltransferase